MQKCHAWFAILLIGYSMLSGCVSTPEMPAASEAHTATPWPAHTEPSANASPTTLPETTPSKTPRAVIDLDGYALTFNDNTCPFKEVEFYNRYVFQADCGTTVYIPQGTAITLTLETPDGQPLPIGPVADLKALFGALEPGFVLCEFGGADASNTITFGSPFQQTTGREILCGFSVPLQGQEVVMVLTGLTTR